MLSYEMDITCHDSAGSCDEDHNMHLLSHLIREAQQNSIGHINCHLTGFLFEVSLASGQNVKLAW